MHNFQFRFEPWTARRDFAGVGLFMNAPLTFRFPLEMFHDVGDVDFIAVDPGFRESLIEKLARRTHKRTSLQIFIVAWLFADEHYFRGLMPFAKDCLRARFP